jgi:hypothetical protein
MVDTSLAAAANLHWHRSADDGRKISRITPGLLNLKSSVFLGASVVGSVRCEATHSLLALLLALLEEPYPASL